jgi:prepilin-type N-terminal cleavage/methylation domain-containing protein
MITRIKKRMQAGGEGGFTLIELLVVIIIIAILAAIAIRCPARGRRAGTPMCSLTFAMPSGAGGYFTDPPLHYGCRVSVGRL